MDLSRRTVLVATHDAQLALSIERVIERRRLGDVIIAHDREQARALLDSIRFETAIVDANLPRRQGMALLLELATCQPGLRRVAMGHGTRGLFDRLIEGGLADAAVATPLDVDELLAATFAETVESPRIEHERVPLPYAAGGRRFTPAPVDEPVIELGAPVEEIEIDVTPVGETVWLSTAVERARARAGEGVPDEIEIDFTPVRGAAQG